MTIALILLFSFFAGYFVWFASAALRSRDETAAVFEGTVAQLISE